MHYGVYVKNSSSSFYLTTLISATPPSGALHHGDNTGFALVNSSIHENQNGAVFLNGEISDGVIEGNRIENNRRPQPDRRAGVALLDAH